MSGLFLAFLSALLSITHAEVDINVATVRKIHANMNQRVLPCDNFWAHACGNWSSEFVDNFDIVEQKYANAMATVLAGNNSKLNIKVPRLMDRMSVYFKACLNRQSNELMLPQELVYSVSDWARYAASMRKYGLNGVFFDQTTDVAYNDSLRYVVQLKMPAQHLNLAVDQLDSGSLPLEMGLIALGQKYRSEAEVVLYSWSLAELKQEIPQIDWEEYFEELLETKLHDIGLRVEVSDVDYLRELGLLLGRSRTHDVRYYLRAQLSNFAEKASPRSGVATQRGRIAFCIHHMRALLPLGMNYIYDRFVYKTRSQDLRQLREIFSDLRRVFGKYLDENRLHLSAEQLDYVDEKLASMRLKLGNLPDATTTHDFFDTHYASANFSITNYQQNLWQALRLRTFLQNKPLLHRGAALSVQHYYVNDDVFSPRNAPYFEHERNTLTIPLIFMQWPLYDYRQHSVFRYSLMGFIVAHEMTHAFEEEGILFDAAGNESPVGVRIRQQAEFQSGLQCFRQVPTASLKERVADVNGLQLAYDAFFGIAHNSQQFAYQQYAFEQKLLAPQLFHLNFAQFFCGILPPAIGHDMDDVRVNVAEKNLHQFDIDFKCRTQSHSINCEMWRPAVNQV
ncbi:hypothetical protein KR222_009488 [Zaprionus bogoriensis]|nr:hypothetical protein KR222_009488 [Zaprionus bogoriensis]